MKIQFQEGSLTVFESALYRTNTTMIVLEKDIILIDPNWLPAEIEFIQQAVKKYGPNKNLYIYFTHADFDHIIGYGAFPGAKTLADINFTNLADKKKALEQIHDFDDQYYIQRAYPIVFPDIDTIIDSSPFVWNDVTPPITYFLTPGHVSNGSVAVIQDLGLCIAGDYLSNIEIPWVEYDFQTYKNTLELFQNILDKYPIDKLIPGHGDIAIGADEIQKRINEDTTYINVFLEESYFPANRVFEDIIQAKGNENQNRLIHQKNLEFFAKNRCS